MRQMNMDWKGVLEPVMSGDALGKLPRIVSGLMVVALIYTMAQLTWKLAPTPDLDESIPAITINSQSITHNQGKPQVSLSQLHLFGEPKVEQIKKSTRAVSAPVTRLNLTLKGVIASGTPEIAKAIIADSSKKENFYSIGAKIPGGAILEEIHATHVILNRDNRLETLQLPKNVPRNGQARRSNRSVRASPNISSSDNKDTGTLLREYRTTLKSDPQKLMDLVRTQPYREKGKLVGYKIRPGKDRKLLRKFGLRSGDVVTGVNGVSLDNPINGLQILKDLSSANQVSVDIKRNGVAQSLSFQID